MKLNHVNLTVTDVAAARMFLETYFGLRGTGWGNDRITGLRDDNGLMLTLMRAGEVAYPASFHVGFLQETEEAVDALNRRLKADGFDVKPPRRLHGAWAFYFQAPGGFSVEVAC